MIGKERYRLPIAVQPPPLLSSLPGPTQASLVLIVPLLFGAVCGFLLSESEAGWWIGNAIAAVGGIAGGYEHATPRSGAARGALAGLMFGVGIVLADAITAAGPIPHTPEPIVLLPVLIVIVGAAFGALGGRLRARHEAQA